MGVPGALPGPLGQFSNMMAVAVAAGVVGAAVTVADAAKQGDAARPNKRSKWDKVPLLLLLPWGPRRFPFL